MTEAISLRGELNDIKSSPGPAWHSADGDDPEAAGEYDCLSWPLMRRLHARDDPAQIRDWLELELGNHFGLDSDRDRETASVRDLIQWWALATR